MPSSQEQWADHPADGDDLMWWVILSEGIFMIDPFESLEEAAAELEIRVGHRRFGFVARHYARGEHFH